MTERTTLARRLGSFDAVVIGLGSMIGAGVFSAFAPAAAAAGSALLIGLVLAAFVAYCNALASAQLAARYPTSGGTYAYGRERLGPWWGFVAGWGFVIGKTASCAAMALTFAAYAVPGSSWGERLVAVVVVVLLTSVNLRGITRTAGLARILVAGSLVALMVVLATVLVSGQAEAARLTDGGIPGGAYGVMQAAGLLFFAFAGYARIATLGEEVRDPQRTIPRAILIALGITVALYATVGLAALAALGPASLAATSTPLATAVTRSGRRGRSRSCGSAPRSRAPALFSRSSPESVEPRSRWPARAIYLGRWRPSIRAIRFRTTPSSPSDWPSSCSCS